MKIKRILLSAPVIVLVAITIFALPCNNELICYKHFILNQRFATIPSRADEPASQILFTGNEQFEAIDGDVLFEHEVIWKSCDTYLLVEKSPGDEAVKLDTLQVEVLSNVADTLTMRVSERGMASNIRMYRVD